MALGFPAFQRHRGPARWWLVAVLLAAYLGYGVWMGRMDSGDILAADAYERLIAANVLTDAGAEGFPDWNRSLSGIDSRTLWEEIDFECYHADRRGDLPDRIVPLWALAAAWFGEEGRAGELLGGARESKIKIDPLIAAAIDRSAAPDGALEEGRLLAESEEATWQVYFALSRLEPEEGARNFHRETLRESGSLLAGRSLWAAALFWVLLLAGLIAALALGWTAWRQRAGSAGSVDSAPAMFRPWGKQHALFSLWHPSRLLRILLAALLGGSLFVAVLWLSPSYTWFGFRFKILAGLFVFTALPTLVLMLRLTPGWNAGLRLFGLRPIPASLSPDRIVAVALTGLFFSMIFSCALEWVDAIARHGSIEDSMRFEVLDRTPGWLIFLGFVIVIGPVCEEFVFRGFLFCSLASRFRPVLAAALSSALFAAIHWYSPAGTLFVFGFGMICCWMTWQSRSLWPSILAHLLFNASISASLIARASFV